MRKLFTLLALALMLGLVCTSAMADTLPYPIAAEDFPVTADAVGATAPPTPDYKTEVIDGEFLLDIYWDINNYALMEANYIDAASASHKMFYYNDIDRFKMNDIPEGFDPSAPDGIISMNWRVGDTPNAEGVDKYCVQLSAATGERLFASYQTKDDNGGTYEFEFDGEGRLTYYRYSSAEYGKYGKWALYFDENGTAKLKYDYTVQFADGTVVTYDRFGRYTGKDETYSAEKYPAPFAMTPNMNVYAALADTGLDLDAMISSILTLDELGVTVEGSVIDIPKTTSIAPYARFGSEQVRSTSEYIDGAYHNLIDCTDYTADDFKYLSVSFEDENNRKISVDYTDVDAYNQVLFRPIDSDPFSFSYLYVYYTSNSISLRYDLLDARYDLTTGHLTSYTYETLDKTTVGYNANGTLQSRYSDLDPSVYPPLTIIGE